MAVTQTASRASADERGAVRKGNRVGRASASGREAPGTRAHRRTRIACLPRVCFSTERRFAFRARAPGRARGTRRARAPRPRASPRGDFEAERVPALRAPRLPSHARGVRARGPSETKSLRLFQSPSNEKSTTTLNRERFRVSCDDAMHEKKNKNQPAGDKQTRTLRAGRATDPFSSHTCMIDRSRSRDRAAGTRDRAHARQGARGERARRARRRRETRARFRAARAPRVQARRRRRQQTSEDDGEDKGDV